MAGQDDRITEVWGAAVSALASDPSVSPQQMAFLRLARPLGLLDGTVLVAVENQFTKEYIETRARGDLVAALGKALGLDARIDLNKLLARLHGNAVVGQPAQGAHQRCEERLTV